MYLYIYYRIKFQGLCPLVVSLIAIVSLIGSNGFSQTKRDESTAEEVQKVNPLTPVAQGTAVVLDNTVNQVLPFDVSTESQLVRDEQDCYKLCQQEKDRLLQESLSEVDRGAAWSDFYRCKEEFPEKAAQKNTAHERSVFSPERAPAGSAMEHLKER
jgi:hypothetical protein